MNEPKSNTYGALWDGYCKNAEAKVAKGEIEYPGHEWGSGKIWAARYETMIAAEVPNTARRFVEIGGGAGKYTEKILAGYPEATVDAFDVSPKFLEHMTKRLSEHVESGRLRPHLLNEEPWFMEETMKPGGPIDCLFSMDALVHVELHTLWVYWETARRLLVPGGKMAMTLADVTRPGGYEKMTTQAHWVFKKQGSPSYQFHYLCPQMVEYVMDKLGFDVAYDEGAGNLGLIATKRAE